jgi:translation initiation factor 2 beta subunit (eIF-2beta)/eIF-5
MPANLDHDLFVSTLKKVLETSARIEPDLTLANTLAQRKAQKLLARVDEFF